MPLLADISSQQVAEGKCHLSPNFCHLSVAETDVLVDRGHEGSRYEIEAALYEIIVGTSQKTKIKELRAKNTKGLIVLPEPLKLPLFD